MLKLALYVIFSFVSLFGFTSINYDGILKSNKVIEARVLVMVLSFSCGYLLANFVIDFLNW